MKTLKMQCCVPFCQTTAEIVSKSTGITFHKFPNEVPLRAAWLRALGNQDTLLSEHAVVCSLHFLNDEICTTDSGSRQIRTGAIPSMVQVCMICLDAHSKLFLMSKYKLDEAYQHLVGLPLCDPGNLKQTACIQCAQRLMNFSRFRDKSLRARALMMELVGKYELISMQHMGMFNEVNNKLKHNIVKTILHPDHCDLYINSDTDKQTEATASVESVTIKNEENVPMSVDEDDTENVVVRTDTDKGFNINLVVTKEEYLSDEEPKQLTDPLFVKPSTSKEPTELMAPIKYEITFECSICMEEFADEDTYNYHMTMHMEEDQSLTEEPIAEFGHSSSSSSVARVNPPVGIATNPKISICIEREHKIVETTQRNSQEAFTPVTIKLNESNTKETLTDSKSDKKQLKCIFCTYQTKNGALLVDHMKTHTGDKPFACVLFAPLAYGLLSNVISIHEDSTSSNIDSIVKKKKASDNTVSETELSEEDDVQSNVECGNSKMLTDKTHDVEIFSCKLCAYKTLRKDNLTEHVATHTFACRLCGTEFSRKSVLVRHLRTHTGEKPYPCTLCDYRSTFKKGLVEHMKVHSGEKPFSCQFCDYKFARKSDLVRHTKTHTGEKSLSCEQCDYKCARSGDLITHMLVHSGEKRHSCEVCGFKFARKGDLVKHAKTHTGEKDFACNFCDYKCLRKKTIVDHIRTHTGEKPFCCKLCGYKCINRNYLMRHTKTHSGDRPFSCELCQCKFALNKYLTAHMKIVHKIKNYTATSSSSK
ncbi:zinc finger protein 345-like isoform X1 [Maniola hyperantus]|uniref:zinc finger protein 345-like isoform X1 n=1 Tax=Aphantopus hyperantus TaxID=2795564 RepID=UPI0037483D4D